jgi:glycosyltransferase involved in cell wall biosynthesis
VAKVDILLPYWGDVELLKEAVESVLSQTEQDWRLHVFDDCYPSDEPVKYFASLNDKRITYTRHSKNLGITNNFNYALRAAKAKYCVMMGCDDRMLPNYLKEALGSIGSADFYQPGVNVIDGKGRVYSPTGDRIKRLLRPKRAGTYSGERLAASLCKGHWLYFPSILWKTKTIKSYGFDSKYKISEDVVLILSILKDGGTLSLDNTVTFQYRRFAASLSSREKSKGGVRFREEDEVYDMFANEFNKIGWKKAARAARWRITSRIHHALS